MEKHTKICRFCSENCDNNFKVMDPNAKEMLGILSKRHLAVSEEAVMCSNCSESFKACCNFKSRCHEVEDLIVPSTNHKDSNAKLTLKDIYLSKNALDVPEGHDVCRLCMNLSRISTFTYLDNEEGGIVLEKMIEKCLPELNLRVIKTPGICVPCRESLQKYFRFITNHLIVEEKIEKYSEATNGNGPIKLKDVLEFAAKNMFDKNNRIKMEGTFCSDEDHTDEQKCSVKVPCTSVNIFINKYGGNKLKETFFDEINCKIEPKSENSREIEEHQFNDVPEFAVKDEEVDDRFGRIEFKHVDYQEMVNDIELKEENLNSPQDNLPPTETNSNLPDMQKCSEVQPHRTFPQVLSVTSHKNDHNSDLVANKNPLELVVYHCEQCSFQTKYQSCLKRHFLVHRNPSEVTMYQCEQCSFQTKRKGNLENHLLSHKDPSEITMYQCTHCPLQTKRKYDLKNHLLTHKNSAEITRYRCEHCSFQTRLKGSLNRHLLSHKDPSEITMYQCEHCPFQTKREGYLKAHLLKHMNPSEIPMYQCELCSFQTKRKKSLKTHSMNHKDPSEITMYQCEDCPYRTKRKGDLKVHSVKHKDPSEITMYQCVHCSFQTKRKHDIENHLLIHKNSAETTMYHCEHCSFKTKRKRNLKNHLVSHRDPSEITMYQCEDCPFQTKRKRYLKVHVLKKHKNPSETIVYQCEHCSFQTKHKGGLANHLLIHEYSSEKTMYQCEHCSVKTRRKGDLKQHLLRHHRIG